MMVIMLERLRAALGMDIEELAGARASAEIPLTAGVLNRLVAARLARSDAPVAAVRLEPRDGGVIVADIRWKTAWVPPLTLTARIDAQPSLPASPVLHLRWSVSGLGVFGRLASPLLEVFDVLPPGIRVDGDRLSVDLAMMLEAQGHGDLLALLTDLQVTTADGRVIVQVEGRVPHPVEAVRSTG